MSTDPSAHVSRVSAAAVDTWPAQSGEAKGETAPYERRYPSRSCGC
jgi:hypothetical protein